MADVYAGRICASCPIREGVKATGDALEYLTVERARHAEDPTPIPIASLDRWLKEAAERARYRGPGEPLSRRDIEAVAALKRAPVEALLERAKERGFTVSG